jgi:hypothetical protein
LIQEMSVFRFSGDESLLCREATGPRRMVWAWYCVFRCSRGDIGPQQQENRQWWMRSGSMSSRWCMNRPIQNGGNGYWKKVCYRKVLGTIGDCTNPPLISLSSVCMTLVWFAFLALKNVSASGYYCRNCERGECTHTRGRQQRL